jgi:hypothetical protein
LKSQGLSDDQINAKMDKIKERVRKINLNNKSYTANNEERSNALKKLNGKYTSNNNYHIDSLEKEADIGGAKATSRKDVAKSLYEIKKLSRKNREKYVKSATGNINKELKKKFSDALKRSNISSEEDFIKRIKSLKDNSLYNIDYYNKNMTRNPGK